MRLIDVIYSSVALSAIIMLLIIIFSYIGSILRKRRKNISEIHFRRTILSNRIYLSSDTVTVPATIRVEQSASTQRLPDVSLVEERRYQVNHRSRYKIINDPKSSGINYGGQSYENRFRKVI
ncbi:MAG: hypothetical protein GYA14_16700 [Ignavibacteria bacterium]|nr:hypothetical protein [Ignavibacteria bacterium]